MISVVVFGGLMPAKAWSKSPRSKFTAPRPKTGGADSYQQSRRAASFAVEMAVMSKKAAWLAAMPIKGKQLISRVVSFIAAIEILN
jgi:hypothetical protein